MEQAKLNELKKATDLCVKCGVCLPHCPTYAVNPTELESPRGRITLVQGLAHGGIEVNTRLQEHLGNCLNCGRCESVCPADVPYTQLIDSGRYLFGTTPTGNLPTRRRFAKLLASPARLRALAIAAKWARRLIPRDAVKRVAKWSHPARYLSAMPPTITQSPRSQADTTLASEAQPIPLFVGCLTNAFEYDIAQCTIKLGKSFGLNFVAVDRSVCCGALHQHLGDAAAARSLAENAIKQLQKWPKNEVATLLSGCGKGLYDNLESVDVAGADALKKRLKDVHTLLNSRSRQLDLPLFKATNNRVAIYFPCTVSKPQRQALLSLLAQVPNVVLMNSTFSDMTPSGTIHSDANPAYENPTNKIVDMELIELDRGHGCCGAAGDHMLTNPDNAGRIAAPLVAQIAHERITHLLVPNLGCSWHLRTELAKSSLGVAIEHPLQWLSRHLSVETH